MSICVKCSNATLYIDGRLRCDLEYSQLIEDCLGFNEGRFKMFKPEAVEEDKVQKVRKIVISKPKAVLPKKRKSKGPPRGQGSFKFD